MQITNKWRVGVAVCEYYMVEVECWSESDAIALSYQKIEENPDHYLMSCSRNTTSIYINDKESKGFAPFVSDHINEHDDMSDFL